MIRRKGHTSKQKSRADVEVESAAATTRRTGKSSPQVCPVRRGSELYELIDGCTLSDTSAGRDKERVSSAQSGRQMAVMMPSGPSGGATEWMKRDGSPLTPSLIFWTIFFETSAIKHLLTRA